jgi:hypothetical protein
MDEKEQKTRTVVGRRPVRFKLLSEQITAAEEAAGLGLSPKYIARLMGITSEQFQWALNKKKEFKEALDRGTAAANREVQRTLFGLATSGRCPSATIFWTKCRLNWVEAKETNDTTIVTPNIVVTLPSNGKEAQTVSPNSQPLPVN